MRRSIRQRDGAYFETTQSTFVLPQPLTAASMPAQPAHDGSVAHDAKLGAAERMHWHDATQAATSTACRMPPFAVHEARACATACWHALGQSMTGAALHDGGASHRDAAELHI